MMKASSYGKFTPSLSSGVNIRGSYHALGRRVVVRTCFPYFLFPFPLSPPTEVPPKMTLISGKTWLGWLNSSLPCSMCVPLHKLLNITLSYQSFNLLLQSITLFHIISLVPMKHAILIRGACVRSDFHW